MAQCTAEAKGHRIANVAAIETQGVLPDRCDLFPCYAWDNR